MRAAGLQLARVIDHTMLKPAATKKDIIKLCEEAKRYKFASAVVNPTYVPLASKLLRGTGVKVCAVVGFPLGANTSKAKAFEAREAVRSGAQEVDMVINIGALKSRDYNLVRRDIEAVVKAVKGLGTVVVKTIIETCLLTDGEKVMACRLAKRAGADFVKTSTGFGVGGATIRDVRLMRKAVGRRMGIKAAGGIKTLEDLMKMFRAGANRIGTSSGASIMKEFLAQRGSSYRKGFR